MWSYGDNPEQWHAHQCPNCSCVWEHAGWQRGDLKAHTCPTCGTMQFRRVDEKVQIINAYVQASQ